MGNDITIGVLPVTMDIIVSDIVSVARINGNLVAIKIKGERYV